MPRDGPVGGFDRPVVATDGYEAQEGNTAAAALGEWSTVAAGDVCASAVQQARSVACPGRRAGVPDMSAPADARSLAPDGESSASANRSRRSCRGPLWTTTASIVPSSMPAPGRSRYVVVGLTSLERWPALHPAGDQAKRTWARPAAPGFTVRQGLDDRATHGAGEGDGLGRPAGSASPLMVSARCQYRGRYRMRG
jgi:hypothetical protein